MAKQLLLAHMLLLTLSACGWQLRDSELLSEEIGRVYLSSNSAYSHFINNLSRTLDKAGVQTASNSSDGDYTIFILDIRNSRRTSTLNSGGRVAEYQLNQDVDFVILDKTGTRLSSVLTATVEKVFEFDEQDVLASANEEQTIKDQMNQETARQILNQLNRLTTVNSKSL